MKSNVAQRRVHTRQSSDVKLDLNQHRSSVNSATAPSRILRQISSRPESTRLRSRRDVQRFAPLGACILFTLLAGLTARHFGHEIANWSAPLPLICLAGNAETAVTARRIFDQWSQRFPTCFYLWGNESIPPSQQSSWDRESFHVILGHEPVLPFADGLRSAIASVMSRHACDYIFTHDDDLTFSLETGLPEMARIEAGKLPTRLPDTLLSLLVAYKPAIAGFPWDVGDSRFPEMTTLAERFRTLPVAPLTGFDNGMVIYHRSVLDLFFPFAPTGEGGFVGKWTLGAHFLQLFGPLIFGQHAIRLNAFRYTNDINLDNQKMSTGSVTIKDGMAHVPWSRHPYEYPMNEAYISFLKSGLHDRAQPWGRWMTVDDVQALSTRSTYGFSRRWILERISSFYRLQHEALSNNRMVAEFDRRVIQALDDKNTPPISLKIIIFTMNRLASFKRLWNSVSRSYAPTVSVTVAIIVDTDARMGDSEQEEYDIFLAQVSDWQFFARNISIHRNERHQGLRNMILESWQPTNNHEYAIFLEDDIEVSPFFLEYAEQAIKAYIYRDNADRRLFGFSLYNMRYNEVRESFVGVKTGSAPYIYQQAQSWGAVFRASSWLDFLRYAEDLIDHDIDPVIPNSLTNRWPYEKSWKKYYMRFMVENGGYLIYPNLYDGLSLSTNHVEVGANDRPHNDEAKQLIQAKFTVPLLQPTSKHNSSFFFPALKTLMRITMHQEELRDGQDFHQGLAHVSRFDKCTMILTVYGRVESFRDRLDWYHDFSCIGQILVIWNNQEVKPPADFNAAEYDVPVQILTMPKNSLNNRFFPWPQIKYDCIINMDDDWNMPYAHLEYAFQTWQGHFFDRVVGFTHQGRNHAVRQVAGVETTLYSPTFLSPQKLAGKKAFYSIVLPSGIVYHRKWLQIYTTDLPQSARDLVDSTMNCDDLLFNYMIANQTGSGPIFIDAWAKTVAALGEDGLWSRPTHMATRSLCLSQFNQLFGHNPLRYTTS